MQFLRFHDSSDGLTDSKFADDENFEEMLLLRRLSVEVRHRHRSHDKCLIISSIET